VHPHTVACTQTARAFQLGAVCPPSFQFWSHSEQLPPIYLPKEQVGTTALHDNELMEGIKTLLSSGGRLICQYKCLNSSGKYTEQQLNYVFFVDIFFSLLVLLTAHWRLLSK
jgi:hypothetical protein